MSFSSDLSLTDSSGAAKVFTLRGTDRNSSERIDVLTTVDAPRLLVIKHGTSTVQGSIVDRHLVQLSHTKEDATTGKLVTIIVNATLSIPRGAPHSVTDIRNLVAFAREVPVGPGGADWTYLDKILRGEV